MKASAFLGLVLVLVMLVASGGRVAADPPPGQGGVGAQAALGNAFTYQGYLKQSGSAVTGACDLRFILYDGEVGGSQVGSTETKTEVTVSNGLLTAQLDFGASAFSGQARWLEIGVRCPAGSGTYSTLSPRQALTATPYALYAASAASATSAITATVATTATTAPWSGLTGVPTLGTITGVTAGTGLSGGGTSGPVTLTVSLAGSGSASTVARSDHDHASSYWSLTGNAGTISGTNFLGTTDNVTLTLAVSGTAALRLEPNATSPNLMGGYNGNSVTSGVVGATISGGGSSGFLNRVTDDYGTVGGGQNNRAGDNAGTTSDTTYATVAGGSANTASGEWATLGGGRLNTASGGRTTVAGGESNMASGYRATVGGGFGNTASGVRATVGAGSSNTASGDYATVSGGSSNTANGEDATVGGGLSNTGSGLNATVGGGESNTASGLSATVGGGFFNAASGEHATVGGGRSNTAAGDYSFAAGQRAKIDAAHDGSFLFADQTNADFNSSAANEFAVRSTGGARFVTNSAGTTGVTLAAGGNSWSALSDRNLKANFVPVDGRDVLGRVAALPITTWNLQSQDPSIRHLGPMAQDFYAAFGLGEDDRHITTLDADGVALAAIQGLYQALQDREARISQLEARLAALEGRLAGSTP